uniref:Uncharacterized protein n=1 Tax=Caenorhabditis japonica TaxID=281687 RepID=A0A8R1J2N8_CAEJA
MMTKNLLNTFKAKKQTDFYEVLKLAESPELKGGAMQELCLSVAFCLARSGKLERSSPTTINARLEASHIFNVSDAQKCDKTVELPGGKQVRISSLIKPSMTSSWIGKTIEKSIGLSTIDILSEIRLRDEFFELYAFPDSNRHTLYPKVEAQFVDALAMCLHVGFGVKDDAWALPCLTSHIKRVCRNYICRARSVVDNIDSLLESFNNNFKI